MIITSTEQIPGRQVVELYGLVTGSTVRAKHIGRDLMASLKNIVGGELTGYTELLSESREEAMRRMIAQAEALGANAVVNVRFATSSVAQGAAELFAYGTAVRVECPWTISSTACGACHLWCCWWSDMWPGTASSELI